GYVAAESTNPVNGLRAPPNCVAAVKSIPGLPGIGAYSSLRGVVNWFKNQNCFATSHRRAIKIDHHVYGRNLIGQAAALVRSVTQGRDAGKWRAVEIEIVKK